jgi:hypothetical protein
MTQDVFDTMAISQVMARLRSNPALDKMLASTISGYMSSYPDEELQSVLVDLTEAAHKVEGIATHVYQTFFEPRDDRDEVYFAVLKALSDVVMEQSRKKRSIVKRIFGGTYFNYEKKTPRKSRR